ncbi:hypothetical protein SAMN05421821_101396 [Mucilaginibacter lappiensis]|uniref:Uncharacterized protein n=1 Tax=Mucilaginibacter lappiensis TaxID=354630 RepID=A0ABR6PD45_9SPHI|nr:hypothetical protein [Mucilaginibacter lappiensis]MBB6107687.1 hypothetical protein [Mucilaginibacter lappiensis]SIQ00397.1 hypothetical protein SAMN05421821_101396 [Mucilaginibacter lappiensis]
MNSEQPKPHSSDVPQLIFRQFIDELRKSEAPTVVTNELEQLLNSGNAINETALKNALTKSAEL